MYNLRARSLSRRLSYILYFTLCVRTKHSASMMMTMNMFTLGYVHIWICDGFIYCNVLGLSGEDKKMEIKRVLSRILPYSFISSAG